MVRWEDLVRVGETEIMFTLGGEVGEQRRSGVHPGGKKVTTEGKTGPFGKRQVEVIQQLGQEPGFHSWRSKFKR